MHEINDLIYYGKYDSSHVMDMDVPFRRKFHSILYDVREQESEAAKKAVRK